MLGAAAPAAALCGCAALLAAAPCVPVLCMLTWKGFSDSFLGGIANAPLTSSKGFLAVLLSISFAGAEYSAFLGLCVIPRLLDGASGDLSPVTGFVSFFQQAPESLFQLWEVLPQGPVTVAFWVVYNFVWLMWFISYVRAVDTRSDALFTIDRQPGEVICDRCSRLKHRHTEHCSYCWRCCDRFDHHSFLVNNCVAERNAKFYTLTLAYGFARSAVCLLPCLMTVGAAAAVTLESGGGSLSLLSARGVACCAWLLHTLWSMGVFAFLWGVWWTAISWGFNTCTQTGRERGEGMSIEVLAPAVEMLEWPSVVQLGSLKIPSPLGFPAWLAKVCSREEWRRQLELPDLPPAVRKKNWRRMMGNSRWWWPSSSHKFPEYNNNAFVFKKAW
eukprot:TRINITY_DN55724_c0_g1_i1.p1 TRINITY_DN55724_c0_g1~~TRINITY_DN55724_c0_g1_i1.p1  ORF type:complete len:412 (+),score=129.06 TRINITY_DN55724_c0_g1_i1:78-1238(+)